MQVGAHDPLQDHRVGVSEQYLPACRRMQRSPLTDPVATGDRRCSELLEDVRRLDAVRRGRTELDDPEPLPVGRSRGPGGGRKRAEAHDPALPAALDKLVDPDSRGDPMTPLRWTSKSLRTLAGQLRTQGHQVSATLVQRLLHEAGYSLQSNTKTLEGSQHPDRDAQFRHIHDTVA